MLLGYDATTIRGNKTGVGYYSSRLLDRLTRVGGDTNPIDELLVLSNRPIAFGPLPRARQVASGYFPLRAPWMQGVLPFILREMSPDLCHFTNYLAPLALDRPFVVTFHDMTLQLFPQFHRWRKRLLTATIAPAIAKRARLVITPSESTKEDLARIFRISKHKIRVIPHAADTHFRPNTSRKSWSRLRERFQLRKPYLLYVGTLEPRKNLVRAVEAFSRIRPRFPDHRFYLAGDVGWRSKELLQSLEAFGLDGAVKHLGYVDEDALPALYSHAELFVYPSLYEGFGFPVLEAMACGVPVLTSKTSSLEEIAAEAALLVDPHDVDCLSEGMEHALSDTRDRETWIGAGLARARSFSWERTARDTLAVYEEALERRTVRVRHRIAETTNAREARAVVDTIAYGAHFDYPMTLPEIERSLLGVTLSRRELRRILDEDPHVLGAVERAPPFFFLKGRRSSVESRARTRRLSRVLLEEHRGVLELVRRTPFVRMVALSGAIAKENAADGDIDLFLITKRGKTWAVALFLFVAMKLLGLRRTMCLNYFLGEDRLTLTENDAFTANQILGLRPIAGHAVYRRFVRANGWGARFFPNFWERFREHEPIGGDEPPAGASRLERFLSVGGGALLEWMGRLLLRSHLRRQWRRAGGPESVTLKTGVIKLHFNDHGAELSRKLNGLLGLDRALEESGTTSVSRQMSHVHRL